MNDTVPKKEGFFWAKWKIKAEGTEDEHESPGDEWEVMHVVMNCIEETDPEHLMVMVPGVVKWQPLENFFWGEEVTRSPKYDCKICGGVVDLSNAQKPTAPVGVGRPMKSLKS